MFEGVVAALHDHTSNRSGRAQDASGRATDKAVDSFVNDAASLVTTAIAGREEFAEALAASTPSGTGRVIVPGRYRTAASVAEDAFIAIRRAGGERPGVEEAVGLANSGAVAASVAGRVIETGVEADLDREQVSGIADSESQDLALGQDSGIGQEERVAAGIHQEIPDKQRFGSSIEEGLATEEGLAKGGWLSVVDAAPTAEKPRIGVLRDPAASPFYVEDFLAGARCQVDQERGEALALAA